MRYTIKNLRAMVEKANEFWPLEEVNGRGNYDRFGISRRGSDCYPGATTQVVMYSPHSTGEANLTGWCTPSYVAVDFLNWLYSEHRGEHEKLAELMNLAYYA